MNKYRYGSHLVPLVRAFDLSRGDVLELGTGEFSTAILHWLCDLYGRRLVSYDDDQSWINRAIEKYGSSSHTFVSTKEGLFDRTWGMALCDESPGEERHLSAIALKDKASYILLHDAEANLDSIYQYSKVYSTFKYINFYTKVYPWTVILSDLVELKEF